MYTQKEWTFLIKNYCLLKHLLKITHSVSKNLVSAVGYHPPKRDGADSLRGPWGVQEAAPVELESATGQGIHVGSRSAASRYDTVSTVSREWTILYDHICIQICNWIQ